MILPAAFKTEPVARANRAGRLPFNGGKTKDSPSSDRGGRTRGPVVAYADRLDLGLKGPNGKSTAKMHAILDQIERNQMARAKLDELRKLLSSRLADLRRELALRRARRLKVSR